MIRRPCADEFVVAYDYLVVKESVLVIGFERDSNPVHVWCFRLDRRLLRPVYDDSHVETPLVCVDECGADLRFRDRVGHDVDGLFRFIDLMRDGGGYSSAW